MKKAMLSTLLVLSTACSTDKIDKTETSSAMPVETSTSTVITKDEAVNKKKLLITEQDKKTQNTAYSYRLNDQKFTSNAKVLVKGSSVSSPIMSESGVLKGSFVVIITTAKTESLSTHYKVNKIAKNTYRLIPIKNQTDLYNLYSNLLKNSELSRVEIEIDYSRDSTAQSY
ncbi:hypothetical protein [Shewanella woodyi]|uniref:hypothetical protein n=1 Tax=Shewanella woodyi TaxID=60961 RepID=UPI00374960DD